MNEAKARHVLLIRAIESADVDDSVLPAHDRERASREALREVQGGSEAVAAGARSLVWAAASEGFVGYRAGLLVAHLTRRYPNLHGAFEAGRGRGWRSALLPIMALILGLASNELGGARRINIIFFPLLGLLLWNFGVYALLVFQSLSRPAAAPGGIGAMHPLRRLAGAAGRVLPSSVRLEVDSHPAALTAGIQRYARDVLLIGAPLHAARAAFILHLSAALFAVGAVVGMYVGGLGLEYLAGWESTFLDEVSLATLLSAVLGPASALTGIALPEPAHLATLRWSAAHAGENAASWIHLYAVTSALFIVVPRVVLAISAWRREIRLRLAYPLPSVTEPYFRRLLAAVGSDGDVVRVATYSYHLSDAARDGLRELLTEVMGERLQLDVSDAIAYGEEDDYLAAAPLADELPADTLVVVFNLAATPEAENHGMLIRGLSDLVQQGKLAHRLVTVLDESGYRHRLANEAGAELRLAQRRSAWREVLHTNNLVIIDLVSPERAAARQALESALDSAAAAEAMA